jgi:uncharacterized protein (DUF433 family)
VSDRDDLAPVKIRPGYSFGRPTVRGLRCENVAERVMAGEAVEAIADDLGLTEAEVLLACWYVATYERRRRAWRPWWRWAREAYHALADGARPVDPFEDERP